MVRRQHHAMPEMALAFATLLLAACADPAKIPSAPELSSLSVTRASSAVAEGGTLTDQHVFLMNGNSIPDGFEADVAAAGGTVVRLHPEIGVAVVKGLSDKAAATVAKGNAKVDRDVMLQWVPTVEQLQATVLNESVPPDATAGDPFTAFFLAIQWNMRQIHALEAWTTRTGSPNVRVAILDTGLDPDHIDQGSIIDQASSVAFTPSTQGPPAWADDNFHGSHVGGIVTTNNIGTAGVAPNVTLIAIKVLNSTGGGSFGNVIAGLIHAANVHADVANMSLGALAPRFATAQLRAALNRAINYANRHDVLVVSASGNNGVDLQHAGNFTFVPCEDATGICVSATGPSDTKASYSNYGASAIDVAAPGGDVGPLATHFVLSVCSHRTTNPVLAGCRTSPTGYAFAIGTSMAAPHVSGNAALLDSQYGGSLNPAQLESKLQQCSDDIGKPGADQFYGQGRINVFKTANEVGCNNGGSTP